MRILLSPGETVERLEPLTRELGVLVDRIGAEVTQHEQRRLVDLIILIIMIIVIILVSRHEQYRLVDPRTWSRW